MPWRGLIFGAIAGLLVPAGVFLYFSLMGGTAGSGVVLLWPSSLMLMATESMGRAEAHIVLAESIAINVAIYSVLGAALQLPPRTRKTRQY